MRKKPTTSLGPDELSSVYLFSGEVDIRRTTEVNRLIKSLISPESEMFGLERFDGDISTASQILPAIATLPFMCTRKVVVVDRVDRLNADDQAKIAKFIPQLGKQCGLILLSGNENPVKRKPGGQSKAAEEPGEDENAAEPVKAKKGLQSVLTAAVRKHGTVVEYSKMRAQDVTALIADTIREQGKKIDPPALQVLSFSMQSLPALIQKEVEKLTCYVGDRDTITVADVEMATTRSPEDRVFALIDAVAAGRADLAVGLLNETLSSSNKPDAEVPKVLALLGKHFRILYQVKFLISAGVHHLSSIPENLKAMLMQEANPSNLQDWQQRKFLEQSRHFSATELRRSLKHILTCELALKGQAKASASPRLNLEVLILKLCHRKVNPGY